MSRASCGSCARVTSTRSTAAAVWVDTIHRWFDYWLQGVQNGIMSEPAVDIEESKDVWNSYTDWPIPARR